MTSEALNSPQIEKLALDTLHFARNKLLVNLRFLDMSISQLKLQPYTEIPTLATDGRFIYFNPAYVLSCFVRENLAPGRDYLHIIFHCLFHHAFINKLVHQGCWDLACDIAVENAINELGIDSVQTSRQNKQTEFLEKLKEKQPVMTAEKLYRHFLDQDLSDAQLSTLREDFYADDHSIWYQPMQRQAASRAHQSGGQGQDQNQESSSQGQSKGDQEQEHKGESGGINRDREKNKNAIGNAIDDLQALKDLWQGISKRAQVDLETLSKQWGNQKGGLQQALDQVTREKYDYADFLKRFSVMGEEMQINDEEFDLVFYTYGLSLYDNMPLIEPLEYKEVKRIKDFVIAIDTSGSVQGDLVQAFIQKTYNILMQTENFFRKVNLHIIQCDAEIQEDVKITNPEEFKKYFESMTLRGFGGTDFRPVFNYVDQLIDAYEFSDLKGLIYFTDGYGDYPSKEPDYDTAFVFIEDNYVEIPDVPYWAIKLVLSKDDIMGVQPAQTNFEES